MTRLKELKTPVFWAEGHPGVIDRESWEIEVTGLCDSLQRFTWAQLLEFPKTVVDARITSVTRFTVRGNWGGIRLLERGPCLHTSLTGNIWKKIMAGLSGLSSLICGGISRQNRSPESF